ncbi:hypothetical protein SS209_04267 [Salmonella enterica subsp. enterica serovar Senftenberg str. SS209]|nr:hypothetical protein SS209_04267 [Salmonella enterica subsp. enterica serovar Senftenberg str. SS209]
MSPVGKLLATTRRERRFMYADNCAFQGIQNFHRQQGIALSQP